MTESPLPYKLPRGRPPKPAADRKKPKGIRIDPDVFEFLATRPQQNAFIEAAIRRSKEFKAWLQSQRS